MKKVTNSVTPHAMGKINKRDEAQDIKNLRGSTLALPEILHLTVIQRVEKMKNIILATHSVRRRKDL